MSASFLTTTIDDMLVEVSVAWGADLTDLDGSSWTWSDITTDVVLNSEGHNGSGILITIGRPDFSQETQTAVLTCELDNRDSAFSEGGMSANWPNVRRGTPVRVRVSNDNGATWSVRFQGAANGFTPQWDAETGRWATVELSASGPLRRLNQGTLPPQSAFKSNILNSGDTSIVGYWPIEDGANSTQIAPAYPLGSNGLPVPAPLEPNHNGSPFLGQGNQGGQDFPCSGPLSIAGSFDSSFGVPSYTNTNQVSLSCLMSITAGGLPLPAGFSSRNWILLALMTSATTGWVLFYATQAPGGSLNLKYFTGLNADMFKYGGPGILNTATEVYATPDITFELDGEPTHVGFNLTRSGTTTSTRIFSRKLSDNAAVLGDNETANVTASLGAIQFVTCAAPFDSQPGEITLGHMVFQNSTTITPGEVDRIMAYNGETVNNRLTRLCTQNGINLNVLDTSVAESATSIAKTCGPQFYDTLTALLRETELTGQGLLYDGLGPGLTYVTKQRRAANANGPASLVIDASAAQMMEPFAPIDDDQVTINHVDATRRNGTVNSYMDRTGPMGAEAVGDYATSLSVNPATDGGLNHYAEWTVGIGTQEGYRYPTVTFALETNPGLVAGWLGCLPQSRLDVTNVTAIRRQHPDETIKLLLEGWQETIDAFTWRVTANTSSAVPWNVVKLAAATGSTGDGVCHMDTDGSQLNANAAAGATSVAVKTISGPLWVTTAVDADSFPFDLDVGGCKVTVTAIGAATSSVQTFTLASPGLPRAFTGSTTSGAGTPVKVWRPPVFGL